MRRPVLRKTANALVILGLAFVVIGAVLCCAYEPRWTPPENGYHYELFETTRLEKFITATAIGAALFSFGLYLRGLGQKLPTAGTNQRRWGFILILLSGLFYFLPFVDIELPCFVAGVVLVVLGNFHESESATRWYNR